MVLTNLAASIGWLPRVMIRLLVIQECRISRFPSLKPLRRASDGTGKRQQKVLSKSDVVREQSSHLIDATHRHVARAACDRRNQAERLAGRRGRLISGGVRITPLDAAFESVCAMSPAEGIGVRRQWTAVPEIAART